MKHFLLTTIAAVVLVGTAFADPIHDAARDGDLAGVQAELDKGVDVNALTKYGSSAMHAAAQYGHKDVVELLITKGANVNAKSEGGATPLHNATWNGHMEIVELLISKGADVNAKTPNGSTPLHDAANKEVAELLISSGADVNAKDTFGKTTLDWVSIIIYAPEPSEDKAARKETATLLREHGGKHGTIHGAAAGGDVEAVKEFLAAGVDADATSELFEQTPLHFAAFHGHKEIAELLIANGADVNATDDVMEKTPLHIAVEEGHKEIVELLIGAGANVNAPLDDLFIDGYSTPLDRAIELEHPEIADLLRKHGGMTEWELSNRFKLQPPLVRSFDKRFSFSFDTEEGKVYEVQNSLNLVNWKAIKTYNGTGRSKWFHSETDDGSQKNFYRVRVVE